jgi:hypothetical protein
VRVADERRVISPDESAVERRADARIGLRTDHDEPCHPEGRENLLETRVLERVAPVLLDERLGVVRRQLGHDLPVLTSLCKPIVRVLDPDNGDVFPARLLDEAADVRDDRVAFVRSCNDAVLDIDDEECGVRPVLECGHVLPSNRV